MKTIGMVKMKRLEVLANKIQNFDATCYKNISDGSVHVPSPHRTCIHPQSSSLEHKFV